MTSIIHTAALWQRATAASALVSESSGHMIISVGISVSKSVKDAGAVLCFFNKTICIHGQ